METLASLPALVALSAISSPTRWLPRGGASWESTCIIRILRGCLVPPRFSPVVVDFRNADAMKHALDGVTLVFHLASAHLQVSLPESEYWDVNVHSLPALLQLALDAGVSRFVHSSSVAIYGDLGFTPANEQTPPHPQSIYGETKLAGERAVLDFGRRQGLEVVVLRPSWVYGPGCARTARIIRALKTRRFFMVGSGDNLRHPLYIADMIDAFRLAAVTKRGVGEILLVAGERAVTTRELIESVCAVFDLPRSSGPHPAFCRACDGSLRRGRVQIHGPGAACLATDARVLRHEQLLRHVTRSRNPRLCAAVLAPGRSDRDTTLD